MSLSVSLLSKIERQIQSAVSFLRFISPFETPQPGLKCSNVLFLREQRANITKILPWYAPCGRWEGMETRRRVETIYELLDGCGYFHWLVAAATDANSQTPETRYVLVNFKDRKKTEMAVSDEWLDDPRRHHVIEELIRLAVGNSSPLSPQETRSTLFSSRLFA